MNHVVLLLLSWFSWDGWVARAARGFAVGIGFGVLTAKLAMVILASAPPILVGAGVVCGGVFGFWFRPYAPGGGTLLDPDEVPVSKPAPAVR